MNKEIQTLKAQIQGLKQEFTEKLQSLESRLSTLEEQSTGLQSDAVSTAATNTSQPTISLQKQNIESDLTLTQKQNDLDTDNSESLSENTSNTQEQTPDKAGSTTIAGAETQQKIDPWMQTPNSKQKLLKQGSRLGLSELLANILGPLYGLFNKVWQTYHFYQAQGKAPAFFMTITGIIALTAGFGYLMQYSFNNLLGEFAKVLIGFVAANSLIAVGWQLVKRRPQFSEYGAALIGLGLTLNYLCSYFIGPYYSLLENSASMALLIAITAMGYIIALLLNTRIVSVVTLIGGATTPLFIASQTAGEVTYLGYLFLLCYAAVRMSQKINWQPLLHLSILIAFVMIEIGFNQPSSPIDNSSFANSMTSWIKTACLMGFFYLFTLGGFYSLKRNSKPLEKSGIAYFTANLFFFIYALDQSSSTEFGILLIVNALLVVAIGFYDKLFGAIKSNSSFFAFDHSTDITLFPPSAILLLYTGILLAVGIIQLIHPGLVGFAWTLEALMLMYLGLKLRLVAIRLEAWVILSFGLLHIATIIFEWLVKASDLQLTSEWIGLLLTSVAIYGYTVLTKTFSAQLINAEKLFENIAQGILSVLMSVTFITFVAIFVNSAIWIAAVIPMIGLLFRAKETQSKFTEYFALSHYLLLVLQVALSANSANSWRFSEQDWIGQIARVEALISLWLVPAVYAHFYPNGTLSNFTRNLRILFFLLLPLLYLPKVARSFDEFLPLALWGSATIAFFLHYKLQIKLLLKELEILTGIAAAVTIAACFAEYTETWKVYAVPGLLMGAILLGVLTHYCGGFKSISRNSLLELNYNWGKRFAYKSIQGLGYYYFVATVFILVFGAVKSFHWAMLSAVFTCCIVLARWPVPYPIRNQLTGIYSVTLILVLITSLMTAINPFLSGYDLVAVPLLLGLMGYFIHAPLNISRLLWKSWGGQRVQLIVFHAMVLLCYVGSVNSLFDSGNGAIISFCLVLHAILVLLQSARHYYPGIVYIAVGLFAIATLKIILWDMSDFVLVEKIIAFMAIGGMLLIAAYLFQKQRSKTENQF